ncbi:hypothetical protein Tsubulata_007560 [Turnera subulata]|uniref:GATA-type domain-containing protein n=1 Tax=Turnera subulata TaxID=218843 RepID=A0A9Q0F405_9ROSI|nr:hypothetical protein Tsubulata_007560 [Turnera subulata]
MDFCRNVTVPGDYHQQEQVLASPLLGASALTPLKSPIDDLFSSQNTEADVSLEWLSVFVEDCLTSTGNCLPPPTNNVQKTATTSPELIKQRTPQVPASLHRFVVPGRARSKRRRVTNTKARNNPLLASWCCDNKHHQGLNFGSTDPPLLQQTHWLADSELILPKTEDAQRDKNKCVERDSEAREEKEVETRQAGVKAEDDHHEKVMVMMISNEKERLGEEEEDSIGVGEQQQQQQPRRCTHCLSQRTPQWRAGPLGPKTLCNACGVRYKSGRLLPEYRPAKSPTFVSYLHSNSHKKVLEMRMAGSSAVPNS